MLASASWLLLMLATASTGAVDAWVVASEMTFQDCSERLLQQPEPFLHDGRVVTFSCEMDSDSE